jgi:hypothetical protein
VAIVICKSASEGMESEQEKAISEKQKTENKK